MQDERQTPELITREDVKLLCENKKKRSAECEKIHNDSRSMGESLTALQDAMKNSYRSGKAMPDSPCASFSQAESDTVDALARQKGRRLGRCELERIAALSENAAKKALMSLERKGLVHRPEGKRSGYALTKDGWQFHSRKSRSF